jgi:tRNA(Ile)-lysidine synthase
LAIALATAKPSSIVLAYISHDIRSGEVVAKEREHVHMLAARLGCGWATASVTVGGLAGNLESRARRERYRALAQLARAQECPFIATGHQATDQLETVLMRLMRGAGPAGLRGIRERRMQAGDDGDERVVIRPMLSVTREESEAICAGAGYVPVFDVTNADESLVRNALRARVIPVLRELAPGVEHRSVQTARLASDACQLMLEAGNAASTRCVQSQTEDHLTWSRLGLRKESAATVRWMLWSTLRVLAASADRIDMAAIETLVVAIRGDGEHRKEWTISTVHIEMTSRLVTCTRLK